MRAKLKTAQRVLFEVIFAFATLYTARPAFASPHLPLQDLPQHMAAIAVLKRYAVDPGLRQYFELTLSRTQYLLVYLLGVPLAVPFGVEYATRLLVALTVVSTPYALRYALRKTGGDERLAALAWPFAWNPQMMLGFLNFLLGIPVALVGIGLFADPTRRTERRRQIALALLTLGAFYSHLIAYGLLGLGVLLLLDYRALWITLRGGDARAAEGGHGAPAVGVPLVGLPTRAGLRAAGTELFRSLAFLLPSFVAVAVWVLRSPARDASVRAGGVGREIVLVWPDRAQLPAQFRDTILAVQGESDERALIAWGLCLLAALALSRAFDRDEAGRAGAGWRAQIAWLPFACALLYVSTPESYGWIWPIHTRFAVAAVLVLPLAFSRTRNAPLAWVVLAAMAWATVGIADEQRVNFQRWDRDELGDLDEALSHAEPHKRLVALVPAMRSAYIPSNVPLLHAAAYYQVRGGDVATFSFADFPQSPFRYREDGPRPPRLQPRWEWETSLRTADPAHAYYDYVLTRVGGPDEPAQLPDAYERVYAGADWKLYRRR